MQYIERDAPAYIESVLYRCISVTARVFETGSNARFLIIQAGHIRKVIQPSSSWSADVSVLSGEVDVCEEGGD